MSQQTEQTTITRPALRDSEVGHEFHRATFPAQTSGKVTADAVARWTGDGDGWCPGWADVTFRDSDFEGEQRVSLDAGQLRAVGRFLVALADEVEAGAQV